MYSRYTPDGSGGFARQQVPEASDLWQQGRPPPPPEPPPESNPGLPPERQHPPEAPQRPPVRKRQSPGPPPGSLPDLGGLLTRLLPRGVDTEDLLVLAVLLLSLKQEGADPIQLLIAVGIYLWL